MTWLICEIHIQRSFREFARELDKLWSVEICFLGARSSEGRYIALWEGFPYCSVAMAIFPWDFQITFILEVVIQRKMLKLWNMLILFIFVLFIYLFIYLFIIIIFFFFLFIYFFFFFLHF